MAERRDHRVVTPDRGDEGGPVSGVQGHPLEPRVFEAERFWRARGERHVVAARQRFGHDAAAEAAGTPNDDETHDHEPFSDARPPL
ncbi:hypothetical protein D3C86_1974580 [compost metagenome]